MNQPMPLPVPTPMPGGDSIDLQLLGLLGWLAFAIVLGIILLRENEAKNMG